MKLRTATRRFAVVALTTATAASAFGTTALQASAAVPTPPAPASSSAAVLGDLSSATPDQLNALVAALLAAAGQAKAPAVPVCTATTTSPDCVHDTATSRPAPKSHGRADNERDDRGGVDDGGVDDFGA